MRARFLVLSLLAACSGPTDPVAPPPAAAPAPRLAAAAAWAAADARSAAALLPALEASSAEDRERATLALGRFHDPALRPSLLVRLRDPSPRVRSAASLGLGALGPDPASESALVAAVAAEADPALRAEHLSDLGRAGSAASRDTLEAALAAERPQERAAACHAAASLALAHVELGAAFVERLAQTAGSSVELEVGLACAHAVVRSPPTAGLGPSLAPLLRAADPELRGMGARALGRTPDLSLEALAPALSDVDPDVVLLGIRALSAHPTIAGADRALADALQGLLERTLASRLTPRLVSDSLGAMEAVPLALAQTRLVHEAAEAVLAQIAEALTATPGADLARLHCGAARLVDLGRGWPGRVDTCGADLVSSAERGSLAAGVVGAVSGAEPERAAYLGRLREGAGPVVREAVAAALGTMDEPSGRAMLLELLADDDLGVVVSAADGLTRRIERAVAARDAAAVAAVLSGAAPGTVSDWPDAALFSGLRQAARRFTEADDLEGLVTALGAITASREPSLGDVATTLALHHSLAVREAARTSLDTLDLEPPSGAPAPPPNPIDAAAVPGPDPIRVVVATSRGSFTIELRPDWAPTTVARFLGLLDAGFYDGLTFHRVVPAFVVQGGDPRGDGYGGPGWSQRCEDNRVRYERGTVGMALAGRDTGGSQFFVTLTPQPHLDGRYTAFGRVVEGMEVVELLLRGDTMSSVRRVASDTGTPAR